MFRTCFTSSSRIARRPGGKEPLALPTVAIRQTTHNLTDHINILFGAIGTRCKDLNTRARRASRAKAHQATSSRYEGNKHTTISVVSCPDILTQIHTSHTPTNASRHEDAYTAIVSELSLCHVLLRSRVASLSSVQLPRINVGRIRPCVHMHVSDETSTTQRLARTDRSASPTSCQNDERFQIAYETRSTFRNTQHQPWPLRGAMGTRVQNARIPTRHARQLFDLRSADWVKEARATKDAYSESYDTSNSKHPAWRQTVPLSHHGSKVHRLHVYGEPPHPVQREFRSSVRRTCNMLQTTPMQSEERKCSKRCLAHPDSKRALVTLELMQHREHCAHPDEATEPHIVSGGMASKLSVPR